MYSISEYELILSARLFVLKRAIRALIVTHPDPARFAQQFDAATGAAQIGHLSAAKATPAVREAASDLARELLGGLLEQTTQTDITDRGIDLR